MLVIVEKSFGRQILVDLVNLKNGMSPIGFQTEAPLINYVRMPYGPYGVLVKATDSFDLVVAVDGITVIDQWRLEGNTQHSIHRGEDGKPLLFLPPGTVPKHLLADAGQPIDGSTLPEAPSASRTDAPPQVESHGLVTVSVRLSHVKPDYGPEFAPDDFARVVFQLNEPLAHLRAVGAQFSRMLAAPELPPGASEFIDEAQASQLTRVCNIAADRGWLS